MKSAVLTIPLLLALALPPVGIADAQTDETLAAADRLLVVQDPKVMMTDMATKLAPQLPESVRQDFIDAMTNDEFMARFRSNTRVVMAKHFTVEELNALADFYSKPVAKSAMAKMGAYMADVMPFVQGEMRTIATRLRAKNSPPQQ